MAIDPSIVLRLQQPQRTDPLNKMAQVLQIRGEQDQQTMRQMQADQIRRGIEQENAMNEAYRGAVGADGAVDRNRLFSVLAERGLGAKLPGIQKQFLEADEAQAKLGKTKAETGKIDFEMGIKKAEHAASVLSTARDQASYDLARQQLAQSFGPQAVANMPPQFDPSVVQAQIAQGMTIVQKLSDERARQQQAEAARHNQASEGLQRRGQDITVRGQNMTDARSREATAATMTKPFEVTGPDGVPVLVQQDKQGNIRQVQGYQPKNSGKTMTEGQAKANLFGSRMRESDRILQELEGKYSPLAVNAKMGAEKMPGIGGIAGAVGNAMLSTEGQQAEQAQRDFVNAVLRRESGAVISDQEFANAQKQYFPQPNDTPQVLSQKRRNRQMAIQGLAAEVPGGLKMGAQPTGGASGGWGIQRIN
jgi:hypothetical protein